WTRAFVHAAPIQHSDRPRHLDGGRAARARRGHEGVGGEGARSGAPAPLHPLRAGRRSAAGTARRPPPRGRPSGTRVLSLRFPHDAAPPPATRRPRLRHLRARRQPARTATRRARGRPRPPAGTRRAATRARPPRLRPRPATSTPRPPAPRWTTTTGAHGRPPASWPAG